MALLSRIPQIITASERKVGVAVEKTTFDIETGCKVRSRVDLGQMKNGWTIEVIGPHERAVVNSVEHVLPNEFGTENMLAQPMLQPSIDDAKPGFIDAIKDAYRV